MRRTTRIVAMLLALLLVTLTACQKSPEPTGSTEETVPNRLARSEETPSFDTSPDAEPGEYFEKIRRSVQAYMGCWLRGETQCPDTPLKLSDEVQYLLTKKLTYTSGETKNLLNETYTITDWEVVDGALWCEVSALVGFRYQNANFDSATSERMQIVVKNPDDPIVVDWYNGDPAAVFDSLARTYYLDLRNPQNWLENQDFAQIKAKVERELAATNKS